MTTQTNDTRTGPGAPGGALLLLGVMLGGRYPDMVPAARARGLTVLGVNGDSARARQFDDARRRVPGHPLAGLAELAWIDGDQHERVVQQALDWDTQYGIRAVIAYGEDYVEAAALVTDLLALPGPGLRAARVCRNKLLQRRYLAAWSPRSTLIAPAERASLPERWTQYPAVLKPLDGSASDGVERIDDAGELAGALRARPADAHLLLEELVEGHELSVESVVHAGAVQFASPTGKRTNERRPGDRAARAFVELGHTVPDIELDDARRAAVLRVNAEILRRLDFRDGVAHAEFRLDATGRPRLMEIAARPGGDNIMTLYHLATGKPIEEAMLAVALGEPVVYPQPRRYARQVYPEHRPGVLRDVTAADLGCEVSWLTEQWMWPEVKPLADEPGAVHMIVVGSARGTDLGPIRASSDRSAMYVIDAPTPAELDALEAVVAARLDIRVEAAGGQGQEAETAP